MDILYKNLGDYMNMKKMKEFLSLVLLGGLFSGHMLMASALQDKKEYVDLERKVARLQTVKLPDTQSVGDAICYSGKNALSIAGLFVPSILWELYMVKSYNHSPY